MILREQYEPPMELPHQLLVLVFKADKQKGDEFEIRGRQLRPSEAQVQRQVVCYLRAEHPGGIATPLVASRATTNRATSGMGQSKKNG